MPTVTADARLSPDPEQATGGAEKSHGELHRDTPLDLIFPMARRHLRR
jgi:hypothetical protein